MRREFRRRGLRQNMNTPAIIAAGKALASEFDETFRLPAVAERAPGRGILIGYYVAGNVDRASVHGIVSR